jgi:hypothetical protein
MRIAQDEFCDTKRIFLSHDLLGLYFFLCVAIAAVIAATSSGLISLLMATAVSRILIADIADIAKTNSVRNANTVPMPTNISVTPWSRRLVSNASSIMDLSVVDYSRFEIPTVPLIYGIIRK